MANHIIQGNDTDSMELRLDISLDHTLGCGQAHRWRKLDSGQWQGVIKNRLVTMTQTDGGLIFEGSSIGDVKEYLRYDDDLDSIYSELSEKDPYIADLASRCPGLRILKQPEWECLATYVLATNANVKRISKMVESVCDLFGTDIGGRSSFPTPKQILDRKELLPQCRLGFREGRFLRLAERTESGDIDVNAMCQMDYDTLVRELQTIDGVGPKVADCVALFGFGKLDAFPVDVRIQHAVENRYGISGSYRTVSEFGRNRFGRYAGYAQELLYHADFI